MSRDTVDRFRPRERGLFGDNEYRSSDAQRLTGASRLHDLTLQLMEERPLSIAVTDPARPGSKWIFLPKSKIEFEVKGALVSVTIPEWLAKEKGLI